MGCGPGRAYTTRPAVDIPLATDRGAELKLPVRAPAGLTAAVGCAWAGAYTTLPWISHWPHADRGAELQELIAGPLRGPRGLIDRQPLWVVGRGIHRPAVDIPID